MAGIYRLMVVLLLWSWGSAMAVISPVPSSYTASSSYANSGNTVSGGSPGAVCAAMNGKMTYQGWTASYVSVPGWKYGGCDVKSTTGDIVATSQVAGVGQHCPAASELTNGACKCFAGLEEVDNKSCELPCKAGETRVNGVCKMACPEGQHEEGGACVPDNCKPDEVRVNGFCVKEPPCPPGQERVNGKCKDMGCAAMKGKSAGSYEMNGPDDVQIFCSSEFENGKQGCVIRAQSSTSIKYEKDGKLFESYHADAKFTGASCSGGSPTPKPGEGGGGGPGPGPGNGGSGGGPGGGNEGGGTGGGGTGGGTGGGGTGGGTGGGGTGGGGTGGGGTGGGGTEGGGSGGGSGGNGSGGNSSSGSGSGPNKIPDVKPPKPVDKDKDGNCPPGTVFVKQGNDGGGYCYMNTPKPPDGDGKCPDGYAKIGTLCIPYIPNPGGGGGGGGGGNGDGDGDGDKSGFGGSCQAGFACEGDAIQCAMAKEQHLRNCRIFDDPPDSVYKAAVDGSDGLNTDKLKSEAQQVSVGSFNQAGFGWGSSCPADPQIDLGFVSASFTIPFSRICGPLSILSLAGVGITLLGSLVWVLGGRNNRG